MTAPAAARVDGHPVVRRWWILAVVGLAQLLVMVDTTVVNIALPTAQRDLGMSDVSRQWTISAYTLAFGGLLMLGGRLADWFGRHHTLSWASRVSPSRRLSAARRSTRRC